MIRPSLQEVADRAIYMLVQRGVRPKHIREGVGVSQWRIDKAVERVESGRYGEIPPFGIETVGRVR